MRDDSTEINMNQIKKLTAPEILKITEKVINKGT